MKYQNITTQTQLEDYCQSLASAKIIGFDTEFVSEDTFRPDLCLIQVCADGDLAVIDTHAVDDLAPFWDVLAAEGHQTLVHAAREEFLFCLRACGKRPAGLFDIQLAAGMVGLEYPAAYGTLISKLLGHRLPKGETRTDWRRRPLTEAQVEYALQDVIYLQEIQDVLLERLEKLDRVEWFRTEAAAWQDDMEFTEKNPRWRRVSGIAGLSSKGLAIVRELWYWRFEEAQRRNVPMRRVLRDDLISEMAKRATADVKKMQAVRGLQHHHLKKHISTIASRIQDALDLPEEERPKTIRRETAPQLTVMGQFLSTALGSMCRQAQISPSLVGTVQDVRDLIAYRLDLAKPPFEEPPRLAQGWRAEVVGQLIDDLLAGKLSIRITDPLSEQPLAFEPVEPS